MSNVKRGQSAFFIFIRSNSSLLFRGKCSRFSFPAVADVFGTFSRPGSQRLFERWSLLLSVRDPLGVGTS
jgi:hypothetical protein